MSHSIRRNILQFTKEQEIEFSYGAKILSAQLYNGEIALYTLIPSDNIQPARRRGRPAKHPIPISKTVKYTFLILVTDQRTDIEIEKDYQYFGSVNVKGVTAHVFGRQKRGD